LSEPPKKKLKNETPSKKGDLEPGEIKLEAQSGSDAEEKIISTRSRAENYVIKDTNVKKTQQKSELKIANVFRVQSRDGTVNLENCTSQFEDDLKTLRKSARKPILTEKMRELEKTKTPVKIEKVEEPAVRLRNQITIKTPQSINNSVKTPPPASIATQQQSPKKESPTQNVNKLQWTKVSKDGQRTKVILSPSLKSQDKDSVPDSKIVMVKRIMQPQLLSGQSVKVVASSLASTSNSQGKSITVRSMSGAQSPKVITMNKGSLTSLNPNSIVIKKMTPKVQIRQQSDSPQPTKTVTLKPGSPLSKSIMNSMTQLKQPNGKPMTFKLLGRGESGQAVILKEQAPSATGVQKNEDAPKMQTKEIAISAPKEQFISSQYIKQLETENHNLKGILLDLYGEMKGEYS
jgi:hypothetical protein